MKERWRPSPSTTDELPEGKVKTLEAALRGMMSGAVRASRSVVDAGVAEISVAVAAQTLKRVNQPRSDP